LKLENNSNNVLTSTELREIKLQLIKDMKSRLSFIDEPMIDTTIWNFLDGIENELNSTSQPVKSKSDISWKLLKEEYNISKHTLSRKIKYFIEDDFKRHAILRDIGNAYALLNLAFYKEAVIISGSIIEEILRLYLEHNNIKYSRNSFHEYINKCIEYKLFKSGINKLTAFVKEFRNLVHLEREKSANDTIKKSAAKNAVSSIFTVIDEL